MQSFLMHAGKAQQQIEMIYMPRQYLIQRVCCSDIVERSSASVRGITNVLSRKSVGSDSECNVLMSREAMCGEIFGSTFAHTPGAFNVLSKDR